MSYQTFRSPDKKNRKGKRSRKLSFSQVTFTYNSLQVSKFPTGVNQLFLLAGFFLLIGLLFFVRKQIPPYNMDSLQLIQNYTSIYKNKIIV